MTVAEQLTVLSNNLDAMSAEVVTQADLISQIKILAGNPEQLSDLTDTYWMFNNSIELPEGFSYSILFESSYNFEPDFSATPTQFNRIYSQLDSNNYPLLYYVKSSGEEVLASFRHVTNERRFNPGCKVVHFTGGEDITNKLFIDWVYKNARLLPMDLTNSTWYWDGNLTDHGNLAFGSIQFTSNNTTYDKLYFYYQEASDESSDDEYRLYYGTSNLLAYQSSSGWQNENYRTIKFNSGSVLSELRLVIFMGCFATLVSDSTISTTEADSQAVNLKSNTAELQEVFSRLNSGSSGESKWILYGTYVLHPNPQFTTPETNVSMYFPNSQVFSHFLDDSNKYVYQGVGGITFTNLGYIWIQIDDGWSTDFQQGHWFSNYSGAVLPFPDDRYRIIDFIAPIEVSKEFYDLFMKIVDTAEDPPYSIGYDIGYNEGYDDGIESVLVEFADWSLTTTSSSCMVSINNTHPSLYLHLDFKVEDTVGQHLHSGAIIIPPDSSLTWDNTDAWGDEGLTGAEWEITINSMRFSKDGV